jgi:hypothetical protein
MWKIPKGLYVILVIPVLASVGLLVAGISTSPTELTDEGYSMRNIFFIAAALFLFFPIVSTAGTAMYYKRINNRMANIYQNGIKGIAEILSRKQTGIYINDYPQVKFLLKITLENGKTYEAEHKEVVSLLDLSSIEVGAKLPVFIDRDNEKNILLHFINSNFL